MGKQKDDGPNEISLAVKYLLFAMNLICWVVGLLLVGIGVWVWYDRGALAGAETLDSLISSPIVDPAWWLVVLGVIIFFIASAGCMGALRENTIFLTIYKVAMGLVLLIEIGGGVAIYYYSDTIIDEVADQLQNFAIPGYRENADFQDLVDTIQIAVGCCGAEDYNDWEQNFYFSCDTASETAGANRKNPEACGVPFSCCRSNGSDPTDVINSQCAFGKRIRSEDFDDVLRIQTIYTHGCVAAFPTWLINQLNLYVLAGIGAGILVVEVLGFCLALSLSDSINRQKQYWQG